VTVFVAFLRGVNLGKRTVKSADLIAAFEAMGFSGVKTLIASGNVIFDGVQESNLAARIEKGLEQKFGFEIGTVLRTQQALREMVAVGPFKGVPADADAKFYVALLHQPVGHVIKLPYGVEGDFEILSATDYDVFVVAWRKPNGRYGEGLDKVDKLFPKGTLVTMRNWNTILKAAA
jgi:uncharacterized protein (DUF1697 family)